MHFCTSPSLQFGHRNLFSRELPASQPCTKPHSGKSLPWDFVCVCDDLKHRCFCSRSTVDHLEGVFGIHMSIHPTSVTSKKYCFVLNFIQWDICAEIVCDLVWSCPTSKSVIRSWYRAHEVWLKIFHACSCHYLRWQSCWHREPVSCMWRDCSGTISIMHHTHSSSLCICDLCIKLGP